MLYRLFISDVTDKLAYGSAIVAALWRLIFVLYPNAIPAILIGIDPLYVIAFAALSGGILVAKYVLLEGFSKSIQIVYDEKERLSGSVQEMSRTITEIRKEKDDLADRERGLKNRLARYEERGNDVNLAALRKKVRIHEDDKKAALTFLLRELQDHLNGTEHVHDSEVIRSVNVLRRELALLDNEVKRGEKSFYEMVLKLADIRENIFDIVMLTASSQKAPENKAWVSGSPWFESDPVRNERILKFLKVAFHPDRFTSASLKEEANRHFQRTMESFNSLKDRLKAS